MGIHQSKALLTFWHPEVELNSYAQLFLSATISICDLYFFSTVLIRFWRYLQFDYAEKLSHEHYDYHASGYAQNPVRLPGLKFWVINCNSWLTDRYRHGIKVTCTSRPALLALIIFLKLSYWTPLLVETNGSMMVSNPIFLRHW